MNIKGDKRTQQLADAREVLITHAADGTPIWTTAGQNRMTPSNKEELSANLKARQHHNRVFQEAQKVQLGAEGFWEAIILGAAPQSILDAYAAEDKVTVAKWVLQSGFTFKQDGLTSRVFHKGAEVASFVAKVDPRLEADVLMALKVGEGVAAVEQAQMEKIY